MWPNLMTTKYIDETCVSVFGVEISPVIEGPPWNFDVKRIMRKADILFSYTFQ